MRFFTLACALSLVSGFMPMEQGVRRASTSIVNSPSFLAGAESYCTSTELNAVEAPTRKLYPAEAKELPKVFGGLKAGLKELVVITGASSGLGLNTANSLARSGNYHVIMACRDVDKAKKGELARKERLHLLGIIHFKSPANPVLFPLQLPRKLDCPTDLTQ